MEWSSEAEMIRLWEKTRQVTTAEPCAGKERCFGEGFVTHFVRVSMRLPLPPLPNTLPGSTIHISHLKKSNYFQKSNEENKQPHRKRKSGRAHVHSSRT
jgi:hypothetical protein